MDNWSKELDDWAREQAVLVENWVRECRELNKPRTCAAMRNLTDALLAARIAVRSEAEHP